MDIMQAILDIENKAQGIISSADQMKEQNASEIEAAVASEKSTYEKKLSEEKNRLREKYDSIRETKMTEIERKYAKCLEELDERCKADKDKWTDEIVKSIINI